MSRATSVGIALVVLGVAALVVRRFTYTDREEILEVGPIEAIAETEKTVDVPLWVGGVLLGAGVVMVAVGPTHRG